MSARFRASKYRHTQGAAAKKEQWYPDVRTDGSAPGEAEHIAASARHVAVGWTTAGSVGILGINEVGKRAAPAPPLIHAHSGDVYDMRFSPHDDNRLVTAGDDGLVKVWQIPESGLSGDLSDAALVLSGHKKRVNTIAFHPTADGVLASGSNDETIKLWDLGAGGERSALTVGAKPTGISFNYDGSLMASTALGIVNVWDPRAGQVVQQGTGHDGTKASRCVWTGAYNQVVTTGFSKMRARQIKIWDSRNMTIAKITKTIDSSTGIVTPMYDQDTKLLFLAGKGDGIVRCYEMVDNKPYYYDLPNFVQDIPAKSICMVPKRACDVMDTEVTRLLKLTANAVIPIRYTVPRKTKSKFCDDLFPNTAAAEPSLSADAWFGGENANPKTVSLRPQDDDAAATSSEAATSQAVPVIVEEPEPDADLPKLNIVRSSHYRHIGGKQVMRKDCFDNIKVNFSSCEQEPIVCSKKWFAVPWAGTGGPLGVFRIDDPMRVPAKLGLIETGSGICDFAFNPFNDDMVVCGLENGVVRSYIVPQDLVTNPTYQKTRYADTAFELLGHMRKVTKVLFHQSASDVLITSSVDNTVKAWDIGRGAEVNSLAVPDTILSMCFDYQGNQMVGATADRQIRLFDIRAGQITASVEGHQGAKPPRVAWLGNSSRFVSSGFTKGSSRQLKFWDSRNLGGGELGQLDLGTGSGVFNLMFDEDTNVLFLNPKGEGTVYFYEIVDEAPYAHFLNKYVSTTPAVGMATLHKTMMDVKEVEIMHMLKLTTSGVDPTSFKVPRTRKEFFQDDIYSDTRAPTPSMTAAEWFGGANRDPIKVSLQPAGMKKLSEAPQIKRRSKYNFAEEIKKEEESAGITKDAVMGKFYQTITSLHKEDEEHNYKTMEGEGCDDDEWSD